MGDQKLQMAVISGASRALKLKAESPHESDDEIIRKVNREMRSIIEKIDNAH